MDKEKKKTDRPHWKEIAQRLEVQLDKVRREGYSILHKSTRAETDAVLRSVPS